MSKEGRVLPVLPKHYSIAADDGFSVAQVCYSLSDFGGGLPGCSKNYVTVFYSKRILCCLLRYERTQVMSHIALHRVNLGIAQARNADWSEVRFGDAFALQESAEIS